MGTSNLRKKTAECPGRNLYRILRCMLCLCCTFHVVYVVLETFLSLSAGMKCISVFLLNAYASCFHYRCVQQVRLFGWSQPVEAAKPCRQHIKPVQHSNTRECTVYISNYCSETNDATCWPDLFRSCHITTSPAILVTFLRLTVCQQLCAPSSAP